MLTINAQSEREQQGFWSMQSPRRSLKYFVADHLGERIFEVDAMEFALEAMQRTGSMMCGSVTHSMALQACVEFCGSQRYTVERANIEDQEKTQESFELWRLLQEN